MVAPSASSSNNCSHGMPEFETSDEKAMYNEGLKDLLKNVDKYMDKGSKSVGKKAADKLIKEYPEIVTLEMIHLLSATGAKMWLADDRKRTRLVVQAMAEIIGKLEKELKGYSTMEHELNKSFNESTGVKETSGGNLKKFFQARVPCTCLQPSNKTMKKEKMGTCCFDGCRKHKPLARLLACAGCRSVTYCCVDCQRVDWPVHSQDCQRLCKARKAAEQTTSKGVGKGQVPRLTTTAGTVTDDNTDDEYSSKNDRDNEEDEEGSLAPDDLALLDQQEGDDDDITDNNDTEREASGLSLGLDEIMGEMDELLNQSAASFRGEKPKLNAPHSKDKKMSSYMAKLYASTSLVPSHNELEKAQRKSKKSKKTSSNSKSKNSDSTGKLHFSMSFSKLRGDGKKKKSKELDFV